MVGFAEFLKRMLEGPWRTGAVGNNLFKNSNNNVGTLVSFK